MAGWWRSGGEWHSAWPWQQRDRTRTGPGASGDTIWGEYGWGEGSWHEHGWAREDWFPVTGWGDDASDAWEPADSVSALSGGSGAHVPEQYPWTADQLEVTQGNSCGGIAGTSSGQVAQARASMAAPEAVVRPADCSEALVETTTETEEQELKRLHAEAMVRFHLRKPSPESEDGETDETKGPAAAEDEVDPEIGEFDPATGGVYCKVCGRPMNSKAQFQDHIKGEKHQKKFEKKQAKALAAVSSAALAAVNPLLTVRAATCVSNADSTVHLWGAYVSTGSYQ